MLSIDGLNTTVGEFQRDYLYKLNISSYPSAINNVFPGAATFVSNVDLYSNKFSIPESSTQPLELKWAGMRVWFPGPQNMAGSTQLVFRCDRKYDALGFFLAWKNLTGDDTTGVALIKGATLGTFEVLMVDVDKSSVLQKVILFNCMVTKADAIQLDKGGEAVVEVTITVNYEKKQTVTVTGQTV